MRKLAYRVLDRFHEIAGEVWGRIASKALIKVWTHAFLIDDKVTCERVRCVLAYGVELGWDENDPTRHVRRNRQLHVGADAACGKIVSCFEQDGVNYLMPCR